MKQKIYKLILIAALMHLPISAYAGVPLETVKESVNRVLDIVRDPSLKGESKEKIKREKIRLISQKMFDYNELSRRTLGLNWNKFTTEQQKEFIELYKSILEGAYIDKIMSYSGEKILFNKETQLSQKTAEVQTTIVTKKADIPIFYRVILKGGEWRVYDVIIEGVSLVSNYRSQFSQILANKSPEGLLETLRKKTGKA